MSNPAGWCYGERLPVTAASPRVWQPVWYGAASRMPGEAVDVEAAVAALYRLPLGEFVAARDQLARQLRAATGPAAAG